jgi:hypothetical protein
LDASIGPVQRADFIAALNRSASVEPKTGVPALAATLNIQPQTAA